jgi:hypothetical protein
MIRLLALINECAKIDSNRHLHVVAAFPTRVRCEFAVDPLTIRVTNIKGVRVDFLVSESPFFFFAIEEADLRRDNHIKLKTNLRLDVEVDQIPIPQGGTLEAEIKEMLFTVDHIIGALKMAFLCSTSAFPADMIQSA